jgi:hypothetical protein
VAPTVHEHRRRSPHPGRVGGRSDDRPPGAPRQLAPACRVLPPARGGARPRRAGERVLHPARVAGVRRALRHARRPHPAGHGPEAVAPVRAAARAAAQAPALFAGARRARPADRRPRAPGWRHALPPARVAAPGRDVSDRLAPPDDRYRGTYMARRGEGCPRGVRGRARVQARCRERRGRRPRRPPGRAAGASAGGATPSATVPRLAPAYPRRRVLAAERARAAGYPDAAGTAADGDRRP